MAQAVSFRGRLARGPVPDGGKLIDLQAFYRGRWRTFATPRTDSRGRVVLPLPLRGDRGRVVTTGSAPASGARRPIPYELGHSRVVRVTVRG